MRTSLQNLLAVVVFGVAAASSSCTGGTGFGGGSAKQRATPVPPPSEQKPTSPGPGPAPGPTPPAVLPDPVDATLACKTFADPRYAAPGPHGCDGCPQPAGAGDSQLVVEGGETVVAASSARFGTVAGHAGNGIWCLESLSGDGANSGTLYTDAGGGYDAQIPLFCGRQRLILGWGNGTGVAARVIELDRPDCERTGIRLTLSWGDGANDMELHLVRRGGTLNNTDGAKNDCTWTNMEPDWGVPGDQRDDPRKDIDWTRDRGIENIFLPEPEATSYDVFVEYWASGGPIAPTLVLNVAGKTYSRRIDGFTERKVWRAGTIEWPSGAVSLRDDVFDCAGEWSSGCKARLP